MLGWVSASLPRDWLARVLAWHGKQGSLFGTAGHEYVEGLMARLGLREEDLDDEVIEEETPHRKEETR